MQPATPWIRWLRKSQLSEEHFFMKLWLNVAEAAEYARVSRDTIYTACERREIHHARIGGRRAIRLKPEWIDAWLERHACRPDDRHAAYRTPVTQRSQAMP
jgi:excisionase family DNA binding protein